MRTAGVMFDWDGVLIDSLGASLNVYNRIFARLGMKPMSKDEYLAVQSPNWYEFYRRVGVPEPLWKEVDQEWVKLYEDEKPSLYPDAVECLAGLKKAGLRLALVSNGSKVRIDEELERFRLRPQFDSVIYGVPKDKLKPFPFMLEKTLERLHIEPGSAVYVGDSPADMQAARNASVTSIALARGPIQEERLRAERPDHIFGGLRQVSEFLLKGDGH